MVLYFRFFTPLLFILVQSSLLAGQTDSPDLRFGMSTVLSGPARELGIKLRDGVLSAFNEVNEKGGVRGRSLKLISLDDGYEPAQAGPNMRKLIYEEKVLAIIGNVGTPTAVVAKPIATQTQTPFLFAFTGARLLRRDPPEKWVVNFRASYSHEISTMIDGLLMHGLATVDDIAFFTQRDAFGEVGYSVGIAALKERGLKSEIGVPHVRYERNTVAVELALADLMSLPKKPKAVIMVGTYAPCAAFIKNARANGFNPHFLNVSFVDSSALAAELGSDGNGVIITQVVPNCSGELPAAAAYRAALRKLNPELTPNPISFEGYIAARILIRALEKEEQPITRGSLLASLESLGDFDIGLGLNHKLSPEMHQACHTVWPTIIRNGVVEQLDWKALRSEERAR